MIAYTRFGHHITANYTAILRAYKIQLCLLSFFAFLNYHLCCVYQGVRFYLIKYYSICVYGNTPLINNSFPHTESRGTSLILLRIRRTCFIFINGTDYHSLMRWMGRLFSGLWS